MRVFMVVLLGLLLSVGDASIGVQQAQASAKRQQQIERSKKAPVKESVRKKASAVAPKAAPAKGGTTLRRSAPGVSARSVAVRPMRVSASVVRRPTARAPEPARLSYGQLAGLDKTDDPLELRSSVALIVDQDTEEVLLAKNAGAVLPIASITKLMTALVVSEAGQSMNELLTVTEAEIDTEKGSRSRLAVGTQLTRGEMLHLALMSSENRAAHALARYYPGGLQAAVHAMNAKALALGMSATHYVEPTGLSSGNQSSASDLAKLVKVAYSVPLLRELSTSPEYTVRVGRKDVEFHTTNSLVKSPSWEIGLQKTGYISEAGRCLVMQTQLAGRRLVMVFLDSAGRYSRLGDAERVRKWLASEGAVEVNAN